MKHKRILALLLSLILIISVFGSSCAEEPAPPADDPVSGDVDPLNGGQPADDGGEDQSEEEKYVYYHYKYVDTLISYVKAFEDVIPSLYYDWRNDISYAVPEGWPPDCIVEKKPWSEDMLPLKAGDIVYEYVERYYSYTTVYETVYNWLESEDGGTRQFLIRPSREQQDDRNQYESQGAYLTAWCEEYLPDGTVADGLGFVLWEGSADELVEIAEDDNRIIVCFPEDFEAIYGMSAEQAEILVARGILGDWSSPVVRSPLYQLTPTEIAAYLAEHLELLEE